MVLFLWMGFVDGVGFSLLLDDFFSEMEFSSWSFVKAKNNPRKHDSKQKLAFLVQ